MAEKMYMAAVTAGNQAYQDNNLEEALKQYTCALKHRPGDPAALLNRAAIVQSMGDIDGAVKDLKEVVDLVERLDVPESFRMQAAAAYLRLGEIMVEKANYKEAVKYLRRANEIEPSSSTEALLQETQAYAKPDNVIVNSYSDDAKYFAEITKGMDVEIRKSTVHGRGLFATKDFAEGDIIFVAPSYVTAAVTDLRPDQQQQNSAKKHKKNYKKEKEGDILPEILPDEGICFHCIRPLPAAVMVDGWENLMHDFAIKQKYNLTEHKVQMLKAELYRHIGMEENDLSPVKGKGEHIFCSNSCKDQATKEYGQILEQPEALKLAQEVDEDSSDATILMAKVLAKLDNELPAGKPFSLGRDLKRLSNTPKPLSIPDMEKPRYEALKAMFKRELSFDIFMQLRSLLNFNCYGVETSQHYYKLGAPQLQPAGANLDLTPSSEGETEKEKDKEEEEGEDIECSSQHIPAVDGASLNLVGSYVNHSCDANILMVETMSSAGIVPFVASGPIKKGDELFWCYAGKGLDGETRRKMLFLQYKFGCRCPKCTREFQNKISGVARGDITKLE